MLHLIHSITILTAIESIWASSPSTTRGQPTQLSSDSKGERLAYAVRLLQIHPNSPLNQFLTKSPPVKQIHLLALNR